MKRLLISCIDNSSYKIGVENNGAIEISLKSKRVIRNIYFVRVESYIENGGQYQVSYGSKKGVLDYQPSSLNKQLDIPENNSYVIAQAVEVNGSILNFNNKIALCGRHIEYYPWM